MKFIITEEQQERLSGYDKAQKMFSKYWDRHGPQADKTFFKMIGFNNTFIQIGDNLLSRSDIFRMLRNWYGGDNSMKKAIEIFDGKTFTINNCGGYQFDFQITQFFHDEEDGFYFTAKPDIENGIVDLIMVGGGRQNLKDAINSDDYGWEIEGEIADCIYELLFDKITETTGQQVAIEKLELD